MADPVLFQTLKERLSKSRSLREINKVKAEIEASKNLELNSIQVLLRYADELAECLLRRDLVLEQISKQGGSTELSRVVAMIRRAASEDDLVAATDLVKGSELPINSKAQLIVYLKKRMKLVELN